MIFEDFTKRKQDFRSKKLQFFQNIFNKKLKYDKKTQKNKSESKAIKKNIAKIIKQDEETVEHYLKVEKELIEYIALLNTRIFPMEKYDSEVKEVNDNILELLEYFKKKRVKMLQEDKNKLEIRLYNYQAKKEKERTKDINARYKKDLIMFEKTEKLFEEIKKSLPEYKKLAYELDKLEQINIALRVKYEERKIEQNCLYNLLDKLKNKKENKKYTLYRSNSYIFKSKIKSSKNNSKQKINISKIENNSNTNITNQKDKKFFISQKHSIYSKINNKNNFPKSRCSSAILNNRYNIDKIMDENDKTFSDINKYSIKLLKELNYLTRIKCQEIEEKCAKEKKNQNNIKNLLQLCVEDLSNKYKYEQDIKKKKILEEKTFILSYLYDNCLKNGEIKELKRQHSMFLPKK